MTPKKIKSTKPRETLGKRVVPAKDSVTDIIIVLDRSGSMASVWDDTIGGYNAFLSEQQGAKGKATLTLVQFDDKYEPGVAGVDVQKAEPLTRNTYTPRGGTALLDAIGRTITDTDARYAKLRPRTQPDKCVFVIITDGHENASTQYSITKIHSLISEHRDHRGWEFVFLGANQDAFDTGAKLGVQHVNTMTYSHTSIGTQSAFKSVSSNMVNLRSGGAASMAFTAADNAAQDALLKKGK